MNYTPGPQGLMTKNAYAATQVATTGSPVELVVLLYSGAVQRLRQAAHHMERGETVQKLRNMHGAITIIEELCSALDVDAGGEVAENLQALYAYMMKELVRANWKNDAGTVRHVQGLLDELRSAWEQV